MRILKECLIVLTGCKAPVDAYRVAMGAEKEADTQFDPMTEMTLTKCVELFRQHIEQRKQCYNDGLLVAGSISIDNWIYQRNAQLRLRYGKLS